MTCPFCGIARDPRTLQTPLLRVRNKVWIIEPLNPVVPGHAIAFHEQHTVDAGINPRVTGEVMEAISQWARDQPRGDCARLYPEFNLITSAVRNATRNVAHLLIHYVPRLPGDGLLLPWSDQ